MGVVLGGAAVWLGMTRPDALAGSAGRVVAPEIVQPPAELEPMRTASSQLADVVERTRDSVVNLQTARGLGAGVIVDEDGMVLTNYHVIADALAPPPAMFFGPGEQRRAEAPMVTARFENEREVPAVVLVADREEDLAVLRLVPDNPDETFDAAALGDSSALRAGQEVFAIGNPFGLPHTVSRGIVSALDRTGILENRQRPVIQLDASINIGNSGGPLFDLDGAVVGIVTARRQQAEGIAFALPIDHVKAFLRVAPKPEAGRSGFLGVRLVPSERLPDPVQKAGYKVGLQVGEVDPERAAARAGLREGDTLVALRGKRLDGLFRADDPEAVAIHIQATVRSMLEGESLPVTVVRPGGEVVDLALEIEAASARDQVFIDAEELLGLVLERDETAPMVRSVRSDSPFFGWQQGLVGTRLTRIMGESIGDLDELAGHLEELRDLVRQGGAQPIVFVGFENLQGQQAHLPARVR